MASAFKKNIFVPLTVLGRQVPEGHIWLEGDNLPWSRDSREFGPVPLALVIGKVIATIRAPFRLRRIQNSLEPAKFSDD